MASLDRYWSVRNFGKNRAGDVSHFHCHASLHIADYYKLWTSHRGFDTSTREGLVVSPWSDPVSWVITRGCVTLFNLWLSELQSQYVRIQ